MTQSIKIELLKLFNIRQTIEKNECLICTEENNEKYCKLICPSGEHDHCIHIECIWKWYSTNGNTCPLCRNDYSLASKIVSIFNLLFNDYEKYCYVVSEKLDKYLNIFDLIDILDLNHPLIEKVIVRALNYHYVFKPDETWNLLSFGTLPRLMEILLNHDDESVLIDILTLLRQIYKPEMKDLFKPYLPIIVFRSNCKNITTSLLIKSLLFKTIEGDLDNLFDIQTCFNSYINMNNYEKTGYFLRNYFLFHYELKSSDKNITDLIEYCEKNIENGESIIIYILYKFGKIGKFNEESEIYILNKLFKRLENYDYDEFDFKLLNYFSEKYFTNVSNFIILKNPNFKLEINWILHQKISKDILLLLSILSNQTIYSNILHSKLEYLSNIISYSTSKNNYVFKHLFNNICKNQTNSLPILKLLCSNTLHLQIIYDISSSIVIQPDKEFIQLLMKNIETRDRMNWVCMILESICSKYYEVIDMLCDCNVFGRLGDLSVDEDYRESFIYLLSGIKKLDKLEYNLMIKAKLLLWGGDEVLTYLMLF